MLEYVFMQRALLVGLMLGLILPCIGLMVILRRQSMIGDALSHSSLAGVAAGLVLGIQPVVGAMLMAVAAAFAMDFFRRRLGRYSETAITLVMSAGVGLAAILSDFVTTAANFHSFLFGSMVTLSSGDVWLSLLLTAVVLTLFLIFYEALFFSAYAAREARLAGVNLALTETVFTLMTALTVALASRTVGALTVSSFMVIPAISAMQIARSFKGSLILSIILSELYTVLGLALSYDLSLKPGGTFVLVSLAGFIICLSLGKPLRRRIDRRGRGKVVKTE